MDLGIYLRASILHGRVMKENFGYILDRVRSKLQVWKEKLLSLVNQITLVQHVLNTMPFYVM